MKKIHLIYGILLLLFTFLLFKESNSQVIGLSPGIQLNYSNYCSSTEVANIAIGWSSEQINVDHWDIMRSTDNVTWDQIATLSDDCTGECHHTYYDNGPFTSGTTYYYHLKLIYYILWVKYTVEWDLSPITITSPSDVLCRDWRYWTHPEYYDPTPTPNDPDAYTWHEESNIIQGVHINLVPGEKRPVVLEQNNHIINFTIRNASSSSANTNPLISYIQVNIDGNGYTTIFNASSDGGCRADAVWYGSSSDFNDVGGHHTLDVQWEDAYANWWSRNYDIYVIPASQKLYKDNYCNTLRLWAGDNPDNEVPVMLSEGFDPYNMKQIQFYYLASEELVSCMLTKGFKTYYLDYSNGGQDIRNNAAVFASAVKYISNINNNQKIVASGVSMGGVIARYAFAKAEDMGNPLPASKFVTFDSPHQGAVFSSTLQDFRKQSIDNKGGDAYEAYALNNYAALELLNYNSYDPSGTIRSSFFNELNNLNGDGYPHQTVNIGVSFSNDNANPNSGIWFSISCTSNCLFANTALPKNFDLLPEEKQAGSYLPDFLTVVGASTEEAITYPPNPELNFIVGFTPISGIASGALLSLVEPSIGGTVISISPFTMNPDYPTIAMNRYSVPGPCYIPYVSALDEPYVDGPSKFNPSIGLPGSMTISPANTYHHDVFPPETDFLNKVLNALVTDKIYLQNKNINDTRTYIASNTITCGDNVNPDPSITTGDFIVESGANITFKAGQLIDLKPGFSANDGSYFHAYIASPDLTACNGNSETQMKNTNNANNSNIPQTVNTNEIQENNLKLFTFAIYPNPNNGNMLLNYEIPENETGLFEVYDIMGNKLFCNILNSGKNNIYISHTELQAGVYSYRVFSNNKQFASDKFIIIK